MSGQAITNLGNLISVRADELKKERDAAVVGDLFTQLAQCCKPNPDESSPIIGYVTRGRGVTIHKWDCPNILLRTNKGEVERLIEVDWGSEGAGRKTGSRELFEISTVARIAAPAG